MFESILSAKASTSQHLPADTQRELVRKYQEEGCRRSLDALVESNLKLVCKVASRYKHGRAEADDFLAEGVQGIMKAADKFNLEASNTFATYAYQWIRHYCAKHLETFVKEPWQQSLSKPINQSGGTVATLIADKAETQEILFERSELIERTQSAIKGFSQGLKERDSYIFNTRTASEEGATLQQIADELGLTRERIRQIENILLSDFKTYLLNVN
tara:strand:- start:804 stop:1451 length:648 start_codon:yes stop_codon:yes gene_type:complete